MLGKLRAAVWAAAVIVSALVGVALIAWSLAVGFTFLVLPIVFCELLLFGALYLLWQGLSPGDDLRQNEREWEMASRYPRLERSRQDHGRERRSPGTATRRSTGRFADHRVGRR